METINKSRDLKQPADGLQALSQAGAQANPALMEGGVASRPPGMGGAAGAGGAKKPNLRVMIPNTEEQPAPPEFFQRLQVPPMSEKDVILGSQKRSHAEMEGGDSQKTLQPVLPSLAFSDQFLPRPQTFAPTPTIKTEGLDFSFKPQTSWMPYLAPKSAQSPYGRVFFQARPRSFPFPFPCLLIPPLSLLLGLDAHAEYGFCLALESHGSLPSIACGPRLPSLPPALTTMDPNACVLALA